MKTIGEFYREKILSLDKNLLVKKKLPENIGTIMIEKDLFGWKLYCGKSFIACHSEEEARYLKIFLETGMKEVYVPKDEEYLKSILPELEGLKRRIDEIINSYIDGILNSKIREQLKWQVYMEITK